MREESTTRRLSAYRTLGLALGPVVLAAACIPIFSNGAFQTLKLVFELSETIASGEERTFQITTFPEGIRTKKTFVQVSGSLAPPPNGSLPERVRIQAVVESSEGRVVQRVTLTAPIGQEGSFQARSKIKKNIGAGDVMTVALTPSSGDLVRGTAFEICVDVVKKKAALSQLPACVDDGNGGGPGGETLTALQSDFLTPSCALAGCHDAASSSAGLTLVAGQSHGELVNVPSSQIAGLDRVTPGDPDNSYLIKKLRGDADIFGDRMPRGGPFLTEPQIARFISWIDDGAPDN